MTSRYTLHTTPIQCLGCGALSLDQQLFRSDYTVRGIHLSAVTTIPPSDLIDGRPAIDWVEQPSRYIALCSQCVDTTPIDTAEHARRWQAALRRHAEHHATTDTTTKTSKSKKLPPPTIDDLA